MASEIFLEGKEYISSKRAAELSGYTQDYVGQLARGGEIDARRIGGLWYVHFDSLQSYKTKAEAYTPIPPQRLTPQQPQTIVSFDGKDYVSANRASEITGYHQDYVGQLARGGKISSRQVGNRWFVDRQALLGHKEEKDRLLAAVQTESVGVERPVPAATAASEDEFLTYTSEDGDLIPAIAGKYEDPDEVSEPQISAETPASSAITAQISRVPIRIVSAPRNADILPPTSLAPAYQPMEQPAQKQRSPLGFYSLLAASAFTVVIFVFVGFLSLQQSATFASRNAIGSSMTAAAANALQAFSEHLEDLLAHQVSYQKAQ